MKQMGDQGRQQIIIIITNFALKIEVPEHSNCRLVPY